MLTKLQNQKQDFLLNSNQSFHTYVTSATTKHSFLPPNHVAIRKGRNAHGGGVGREAGSLLTAFRGDITAESLDYLN